MNVLDIVYIPLAIVTAPWWAGKKRAGWGERLGQGPALPPVRSGARGRVLVHAVSVGEVNALREMIPLRAKHADVVVSATTDTGLKRATELFGSVAAVVRYPLDFSWSVRRFLERVRPDAAVLVELEIWPNFVSECHKRGLPVAVVTGRLSERSFKGYRRFRWFFRQYFERLSLAAVQDADYRERFLAMGARADACWVTGSMKWDAARLEDTVPGAERLASELGIDPSRPLVVAGSTGPLPARGAPVGFDGRDGRPMWCEEALLHAACPPGVQLLCAPRKPERFDEAAAAMPGCTRRSRRGAGQPLGGDRFLLDSMGELRAAYALADVAVVGRSFGSLYGSDPVEPVSLGKATVIGPRYGDFQQAVGALSAGDGIRVVGAEGLRQCLDDLLADRALRTELGKAGRAVICEHQGASGTHAELIVNLLDNASRAR
ncbi:MAG: 3-deoxy-D-manno-octulosonic acid transferase [Phycisphaerales bacterium]